MRIRKLRWSKIFRLSGIVVATTFLGLSPQTDAQAGPFADWWGNGPGNAYTGYPNTSYAPILPAGLPQAQVGVLPTGAYASQYYQAPTTYYRPVTSFDPRLGTTVTTLQPCTSYQYQAQRVPVLVPETHSMSTYGSYGAASQTRYSPAIPPSNASASGQSTLSIPSGLGSQYTAPVIQLRAGGVPMYSQAPYGQPITNGYGGVSYGPTAVYSNSNATTGVTSPVTTAVVPAAAWTTTTTNGGYIGNGSLQFSQPAMTTPMVPAVGQPQYAATTNIQPLNTMAYGPGATVTPLGPPVISAVPTNDNLMNSSPSPAFGPMPGAMGSSIMPGAIYPNDVPGGTPSLRDSESTVVPQLPITGLPPTALKPVLPLPSATTPLPSRDVLPSDDILPDLSNDTTSRFQLRRVERDIVPPAISSDSQSAPSPFGNPSSPETLQKPSFGNEPTMNESSPGVMQIPSIDSPARNKVKPELELKLESLKSIPAPPSFDASPSWRPVLLTPRDQTAGLPDRPRSSISASHRLIVENERNGVSAETPRPQLTKPLTIEEELQSNLVYFNPPAGTRKP